MNLVKIDYQKQVASFKCTRKHFIKTVTYFIYVLTDYLIICKKQKDPRPKYVVSLSLEQTIQWNFGPDNVMVSFGIKYKEVQKQFTADFDTLKLLKNLLSCKLKYQVISNFYQAVKCLGNGKITSTYLVQDNQTSKFYASKCFDKIHQSEDSQIVKNELFEEIQILRKLDHTNIIRVHEVYEGDNTIYMILDYLEGKCLHNLIESVSGVGFKFNQIQQIMKQLLQGISYLHEMNIMHRDIKPENIMFLKKHDLQSLKIVDFGMATYCDSNLKQNKFSKCGTPGYVAPEVANLNQNGNYDKSCDIFSIGVLMYKLLTLKDLFPGKDFDEVWKLNQICKFNILKLHSYNPPSQTIDLISKLLEIDPQLRITAKEALNHEYFKNIKDNIHHFADQQQLSFLHGQENQMEFCQFRQQAKSLEVNNKFEFDSDIDDDSDNSATTVPCLYAKGGRQIKQQNRVTSITLPTYIIKKGQLQSSPWLSTAHRPYLQGCNEINQQTTSPITIDQILNCEEFNDLKENTFRKQ